MDREALDEVDSVTRFLDRKVDEDPGRVVSVLTTVVANTFGESPQPVEVTEAAILMNAAGVVINAASRMSDEQALLIAERWMTLVIGSGLLTGTRFETAALYNLANCQTSITDICVARAALHVPVPERALACVEARFADRERLRLARMNLWSAAVLSDDGRERGMRLCNLANTLDHSGRWVEAYDAYVRALQEDPENGNAAGNAADLISRVIGAGWDYEGHLCALYDKYLRQAKANRAVTVAVAGEGAAQRYDEMELVGSDVPLATSYAEDDAYRSWITRHRLALVAALEGLGCHDHSGRWDTIALNSVTSSTGRAAPPAIFAILNVLKADFLVARRLAFDAEQSIDETGGWAQQPSDPGVYTDTLNYAVYGEVSSKLVLAHRAALDVLDKTAVAVNEHLQVGDDPRRVSFRKFWFDDAAGTQLRSALMHHKESANAVLSMAELALDMTPGGLYGHAQDVRNAGTHRFVKIHLGVAEIESTPTMQAIPLDAMRETCLQSLTVARAAYVYLVELLRLFEAGKASSSSFTVPLALPDSL